MSLLFSIWTCSLYFYCRLIKRKAEYNIWKSEIKTENSQNARNTILWTHEQRFQLFLFKLCTWPFIAIASYVNFNYSIHCQLNLKWKNEKNFFLKLDINTWQKWYPYAKYTHVLILSRVMMKICVYKLDWDYLLYFFPPTSALWF